MVGMQVDVLRHGAQRYFRAASKLPRLGGQLWPTESIPVRFWPNLARLGLRLARALSVGAL